MDIEKDTEDNIPEESIPMGAESENGAEPTREEQIQYFVLSVFGDNCSVEDAIKIEKSKKNIKRKSFQIINSNIRRIYLYAFGKKLWINLLILQANALKLHSIIMQNISLEYHDDAINKLREVKHKLTELNRLLITTKKALMRLQLTGTAFCNVEISDLVSLIFEKEELLVDGLADHFDKRAFEIKGITYIPSNKNQKQLTDTSAKIDESVKVLGLKQTTLSDKK